MHNKQFNTDSTSLPTSWSRNELEIIKDTLRAISVNNIVMNNNANYLRFGAVVCYSGVRTDSMRTIMKIENRMRPKCHRNMFYSKHRNWNGNRYFEVKCSLFELVNDFNYLTLWRQFIVYRHRFSTGKTIFFWF